MWSDSESTLQTNLQNFALFCSPPLYDTAKERAEPTETPGTVSRRLRKHHLFTSLEYKYFQCLRSILQTLSQYAYQRGCGRSASEHMTAMSTFHERFCRMKQADKMQVCRCLRGMCLYTHNYTSCSNKQSSPKIVTAWSLKSLPKFTISRL